MQTIVLTIHVIACLGLVLVVLLQSGKEGMGVIFGGGSQSFFGSTGAGGLLTKVTACLVVIFLTTSLGYNLLLKRSIQGGDSLMQDSQALEEILDEPAKPAVTFEDKPASEAPAATPAAE